MAAGIITAICSLLALAFGIYKWIKRMKREQRRIADECKKKLDDGIASGDTSTITAAFGRMHRIKD